MIELKRSAKFFTQILTFQGAVFLISKKSETINNIFPTHIDNNNKYVNYFSFSTMQLFTKGNKKNKKAELDAADHN